MRCGMIVDYAGEMKAPPTAIPRLNPTTNRPNSDYGYGVLRRTLPPADAHRVETVEPALPEEAIKRR